MSSNQEEETVSRGHVAHDTHAALDAPLVADSVHLLPEESDTKRREEEETTTDDATHRDDVPLATVSDVVDDEHDEKAESEAAEPLLPSLDEMYAELMAKATAAAASPSLIPAVFPEPAVVAAPAQASPTTAPPPPQRRLPHSMRQSAQQMMSGGMIGSNASGGGGGGLVNDTSYAARLRIGAARSADSSSTYHSDYYDEEEDYDIVETSGTTQFLDAGDDESSQSFVPLMSHGYGSIHDDRRPGHRRDEAPAPPRSSSKSSKKMSPEGDGEHTPAQKVGSKQRRASSRRDGEDDFESTEMSVTSQSSRSSKRSERTFVPFMPYDETPVHTGASVTAPTNPADVTSMSITPMGSTTVPFMPSTRHRSGQQRRSSQQDEGPGDGDDASHSFYSISSGSISSAPPPLPVRRSGNISRCWWWCKIIAIILTVILGVALVLWLGQWLGSLLCFISSSLGSQALCWGSNAAKSSAPLSPPPPGGVGPYFINEPVYNDVGAMNVAAVDGIPVVRRSWLWGWWPFGKSTTARNHLDSSSDIDDSGIDAAYAAYTAAEQAAANQQQATQAGEVVYVVSNENIRAYFTRLMTAFKEGDIGRVVLRDYTESPNGACFRIMSQPRFQKLMFMASVLMAYDTCAFDSIPSFEAKVMQNVHPFNGAMANELIETIRIMYAPSGFDD